jgi:hypothetical protein
MSTFEQAVRAALDEIDGNTHLDHWRVYDSDKLTESILAHLTAWAIARAEAEDNNQPVPNGDAGEPRETKGPAVYPRHFGQQVGRESGLPKDLKDRAAAIRDADEAAGWAS